MRSALRVLDVPARFKPHHVEPHRQQAVQGLDSVTERYLRADVAAGKGKDDLKTTLKTILLIICWSLFESESLRLRIGLQCLCIRPIVRGRAPVTRLRSRFRSGSPPGAEAAGTLQFLAMSLQLTLFISS